MNKRAKLCLYIFLVCSFIVLGVIGYFILGGNNSNVKLSPKYFTFVGVQNAESYTLSASKEEDNSQVITVNCKISKQETQDPNEFIYHSIVTDNENVKLLEQTYFQSIKNIDKTTGKIDCELYDFSITLFDKNGAISKTFQYPSQEFKKIDEDTICFLIVEYFMNFFNEDGTYNIQIVGINSDGQPLEETRKDYNYNYEAYFENEFKKRKDFFMNGAWYDYIIMDKDELKMLVWHTILYQEKNVSFYVKSSVITPDNIRSLVREYSSSPSSPSSYPEYDGLNSIYAEMEGNIAKITNISYYLDYNHTKNYKVLGDKYKDVKEEAESKITSKEKKFNQNYIKVNNENSQNRVLDIESETNTKDEVVVYNTEQLFMVVQFGAKPIIEDKTSVVARIYENAKKILLEINNSNSLTPFEKALNIYRYICGNIVYDHVTYNYMKILDDSTVASFGNINCFYLEGALLDLENQYAVCDGLSKAYALLANMEGINCVKINGKVRKYETSEWGEHAWNKVNIVDSKYNLNGWFPIDTTWGVENVQGNEITAHAYFLRLGSEQREVKFDPQPQRKVVNVDYYKLLKYETNNKEIVDFNISSNKELTDLINYAKSSVENSQDKYFTIEFKIDNTIPPLMAYSYFEGLKYATHYPNIMARASTKGATDAKNTYFDWLKKVIDPEVNIYCYDALFMNNVVVLNISKIPPAQQQTEQLQLVA